MHAKGSGASGARNVTHGFARRTKVKLFFEVGRQAEMSAG